MSKIVIMMEVILPETIYDEFLTELERNGEVNLLYSGHEITLKEEET